MSSPGVWDVLLDRRAGASRPNRRQDGHSVALVIEGGGNRAAYSAGMAIGLQRAGLVDCFDHVYGTSGGALNGAWLLTGEGERWLPLWASPEYAAQRVADMRHVLRGKAVVDLERLLHHVYVEVFPMDFAAVLASPIRLHPIATDARTGSAVDLAPSIRGQLTLQTALRATASLPLLAGRPVRLDGHRYVDGGLSEPVPFRTALAQGATHLLVLRTRRMDQAPSRAPVQQRVPMAAWFRMFAPGAHRGYAERHLEHVTDERELLAAEATIAQVRPPAGSPDVSRLSGNLSTVGEAIEIGCQALLDAVPGAARSSTSADDLRSDPPQVAE